MTITIQELRGWLDAGKRLQLVDVRSASEYAAGHIPGAINIPYEQAEARTSDLDRHGEVVLLCRTDRRAAIACEVLQAKHPNLQVLQGGTNAWTDAGFPLVVSSKTRWSIERQVRLMAGALVFTGIVLSLTVNPAWLFLSGFVSVGLIFAGLTDFCPMAMAFGAMPWNRAKAGAPMPTCNEL